jgi:hypothetical protein
MLPSFDIIGAGVGNNCNANARSSEVIQRVENRTLDLSEPQFKTPLSAGHGRQDFRFIHGGVQRMRDKTHALEAIAGASDTTAEHIVIVVEPMPFLTRDPEDLRDRRLSNKRRRWHGG